MGSSSWAGAGPSMKWMYTYGPATATTATNTAAPTQAPRGSLRPLAVAMRLMMVARGAAVTPL